MPPQAKAKVKAKKRVLAMDEYAQVPRDMQAAACLLDDRDLVKRTQNALDERHARDDRIDYLPAGGEEVKTLAKKVEGMKEQLKGMGSRVHAPSVPPRSRSPHRHSGFPMFEPYRRSVSASATTSRPTFAPSEERQELLDRQMEREFMPSAFRAPSLDTFAGREMNRALFGDARVAAARAALRGRRPT